ncbi:PAS domain-containing sensor histidine kinase [Mucilaginibacter limnophilus]|uniref:histidine kinase n=1 Tax=Mucilaginibacter limnophilus TaxID=1932778 RepID=A0A437MKP0_9SPHI|nr:PAS domain-containing sensor histidine kinase [Mucilaginibacter limnophilus]RVT98176.1 PAS domain-containing sensor histidine kinase [Mucilaginibacter limnophilus]
MNDFNILFYSSPQPMWIYDTETLQILEVNDAAVKRYGYTREEFIGKSIKELRPPEDIVFLEQAIKNINISPGEVASNGEFRHRTRDNVILNVELITYPLTFNGRQARLVQTQNIDAQKAMQGKLQLTQSKLDKLLDSTSIGFFQLDNNLNFTYWNNAAEKLIGYTREYVIGKNIWEVFPDIMNSDFHVNLEKAIYERVNVEFTDYFWPLQKWFFTNAYPGEDGVLVHFRDVTHIKRSQEALLEKIDQLKEVSFLNSHYIRKPVASLLGLTSLIKENLIGAEEFKVVAEQIQVCSLELDEVIKKINRKVNDGENLSEVAFAMEEFSFKGLLEDIIREYQSRTPYHDLVLQNDENVMYYGNKQGIKIAIESLLENAIKYSPEYSHVTVTLKVINQNIVLAVQDFGIGMDARFVNRIFLSFTKKELVRELGEGLAKVAEVTRRHNGSIWVESRQDKGSTFSIRFPMSNLSAFKTGSVCDYQMLTDPGVEIKYIEDGHYLHIAWRGFHSLHSIKAGCFKVIEALTKHNCIMVLNDNTKVMGSWEDAVDWVGNEFFLIMEKGGLKYLAWVYSSSTFSRLAADLTIDSIKADIIIKTFEDITPATQWLEDMRRDCEKA